MKTGVKRMDYREEMKHLRAVLNEHGYRYYVLDDPTIPDYEYDQMLRRWRSWKGSTRKRSRPIRPPSGWAGRS